MRHLRNLTLLLALLLFNFGCQKGIETTTNSSSGMSQPVNNSKLTTDKVQRAVDKALDWTRKGGRATVAGIQELPQENSAKADIRFDGFQYNANMAGTPISKDKKAPPEPDINDPKFYEKMYQNRVGQTQVESYSGQGVAILKRYNDGRWVLTGVNFNFVGVNSEIEIQ